VPIDGQGSGDRNQTAEERKMKYLFAYWMMNILFLLIIMVGAVLT
jgi:hypothetical protein